MIDTQFSSAGVETPAPKMNGHSIDDAQVIPQDTTPQDTITHDTTPQDTIVEVTKQQDTAPQAIIPQEPLDLGDGATYWWLTSGQDLSRMLTEAGYPEECRRQFLDFYRNTVCPQLGGRPEPGSLPAAVGWDGNPFEYSFEFKGSTKKAGVRFVLDLSELRPGRKDGPLDLTTVEKVLDVLREKSPMYDETWVCDVNPSLCLWNFKLGKTIQHLMVSY